MRENPTACKVATTLIGATLGAVGGGVGVDQIEKGPDDGESAAGAAAGLVAGGLIGYLIGHYACPSRSRSWHRRRRRFVRLLRRRPSGVVAEPRD
jgi:hypothetical protein